MKIFNITIIFLFLSTVVFTQNNNYNYQHTIIPLSSITSESTLNAVAASYKMESIEYKDGIGRTIQVVNKKTSPAGNDQIQPIVYDNLGRQIKQYLPYTDPNTTSTSGDYRPSAITAQQTFYTSTSKIFPTNSAFSEIIFDNSPLDIVKESSAPGTNWNLSSGHTSKSEYKFNSTFTTETSILLWSPQSYGANSIGIDGAAYYPINSIIVTKNINPDGNYSLSYTDKFGNLLRIDEQYTTTSGIDLFNTTSYVYNDFNQLTCIIPPKVYASIIANADNEDYSTYSYGSQIYQYEYDAKGRVARQRKPDCGWTSYVYNALDQIVLSQDESQRINGQWTFFKYDVFERPIMNGLFNANSLYGANAKLQPFMQTTVDGLTSPLYEDRTSVNYSTQFGYTNACYPLSSIDIHAVNYYDDYDFNYDGTADYSLNVTIVPGLKAPGETLSPRGYTPSSTLQTKGLLTGVRVKVLETSPTVPWLISAIFYDEKEQIIQTQTNNYAGGTDRVNLAYSFTGNVVFMQRVHTGLYSTSLNILNRIDYDRVGRVNQIVQKVNNDPAIILSKNKYNEIDQLIEKNIHSINGTSFLQSMDYTYNEQGWLTHMNNADLNVGSGNNNDDSNDMFGYELKYNTSSVNNPNAPVSHSGRITEVLWKSISDANKKSYACKYDKASRMLAAYYSEYAGSTWSTNVDKFSEYDINYDPNGNITALKRKGYGSNLMHDQLIDNLSFNFNGNKINTVVDAATIQGHNDFKPTSNSYVYDANGNITFDPSKNITIAYNHLNLPISIVGPLGTLQFTYDADGNRLKKKWTPILGSVITNYYVNGVVYNSTLLEYFGTSEGRLVPAAGTPGWQYRYEYNYKDHLGNTRLAYSDINADGTLTSNEVLQENNYYAFGLDMYGLGKVSIGDKLKFGDKEYVDESGANLYDFGARYYSPVIARFLNVDPLAENTPNQGTYNYALNSPFNFNDPTGMEAEFYGDASQPGGGDDPRMTRMRNREFNTFIPANGPKQDGDILYPMNIESKPIGDISLNDIPAIPEIVLPEIKEVESIGTKVADAVQTTLDVVGLVPGLGEVADGVNALIYLGRGDYTNAGLSAAAMIPFAGWAATGGKFINKGLKYSKKAISKVDIVKKGDDIALGLGDDLFKFAENKGLKTYRDFSSGLQKDKILSFMNDGSNTLHFNLTGFSKHQFSKFNPNGIISHGNITNWELNTILNNPLILNRTNFYRFSDGMYNVVPNPFK
jgi:RHS repeat-associated protein